MDDEISDDELDEIILEVCFQFFNFPSWIFIILIILDWYGQFSDNRFPRVYQDNGLTHPSKNVKYTKDSNIYTLQCPPPKSISYI